MDSLPSSVEEFSAAVASVGDEALQSIGEAETPDDLIAIEATVLGKKSALSLLKTALSALAADDRREAGLLLNETTNILRAAHETRRIALADGARTERLAAERLDLTETTERWRVGHAHLVSRTRDALEDVFIGMGFTVAEGPEAETDWYNFEALNIPPDHPARGMWDTLYLADTENAVGTPRFLLRTHTSPVQIHIMEEQGPPIYSIMPGRTYRRDTPDARHLPTFHQIEGLVVDKGISFADLAGTIEAFTQAYFGSDIHARLRPSYFPFTEPSAEFEITCTICAGSGCRTCSQTGWIELGGCGMVDPAVFGAVGIDPEVWTGFAFGFGIDRCAQMKHSIADMRILCANDLRFISQF